MYRVLYLAVVFLVGCQNLVGPRQRQNDLVKINSPYLTIEEQKQLGRDRLAWPEANKAMVPRDYSDVTGPYRP